MDKKEFIKELQERAKANFVPIIRSKSAVFLQENVKKLKPQKILEIGTAIGYSACLMLDAFPDAKITTIELNSERFNEALENFKKYGVEDKIIAINDDAINVLQKLSNDGKHFDFIFLDGPKGQYIKYLPYLDKLLVKGGVLLADNIHLFGLVEKDGKINHKHRTMVNNMRKFLSQIQGNDNYKSTFFEEEDGMILCEKIK